MDRRKKLIRNSFIFTLGNLGSKLIAFIMLPLYTYTLSTSEFGTVDLLITTVNLFLPIVSLSIGDAIFRFSMDHSENASRVLSNGVAILSVLSLGTVLLSPLFFFFKIPYVPIFLLILIASVFFTAFQNFSKAIGKSLIFAVSGIINAFTFATLNLVFLWFLRLKVSGYLAAYFIGILVALIYVFLSLKAWRYIDLQSLRLFEIKRMLRFSLPLIPNSLAWWLSNDANRFFILKFVGVGANGVFAVANKIPSVVNVIFNIFSQAWQISAVDEFSSDDRDTYYSNVLNKLQEVQLLFIALIILIVRPVFNLVIAAKFQSAWIYVCPLLLGALFSNSSSFLGTIFIAAKKTSAVFLTTIFGTIINLVLSFVFTPYFGIFGTSFASMIAFFVMVIQRVRSLKTIVRIRVSWTRLVSSSVLILIESFSLYAIDHPLSWLVTLSSFLSVTLINRRSMSSLGKIFGIFIKRNR